MGELQWQLHSHDESHRNPSASYSTSGTTAHGPNSSRPNLATQMANLEAYGTDTRAGTAFANADPASSDDGFPTPRPRVRADFVAHSTAAQMADLKARAADTRSLAAQMAN